jgi:serpin B
MRFMKQPRPIAVAVAIAVSISVVASGCAATPAPQPPAKPVVLTASQVAVLRGYGQGDTAFGLNLLSRLCAAQPGGNVVLSPVSLATGLGMAYLGARGATAAAMAKVLHLPASPTAPGLISGLRARAALLGSLNQPGVTFRTSNRIWADPTLTTNPGFVAALKSSYQAGLRHVPLLSNADAARRAINASVAADTDGHIRALLPPGALASTPGWILTDALYLNARWEQPFLHTDTAPGPFATDGGQVRAEYLNGEGFAKASAAGWTAAELPYQGGRLSMLALLPPVASTRQTGAAAACQLPTAATIGSLAAKLAVDGTGDTRGTFTAVALPKISLSGSESMKGVLTALGMGIAFSADANFRGVSPQAGYIGFVQHAATLAVGEKGTVASAATAVGLTPTTARAPETVLHFNRPYLLLIRDSRTGEPLMLAWVANPAAH